MIKRLIFIVCVSFVLFMSTKGSVFASNLNEETMFNNVVIFIRFSDEENYTSPYDLGYYDDLFNGVDQMSLRDYFQEVSYNQTTIDSHLVSDGSNILYYTDNFTREYYMPFEDEYGNTHPSGYSNEEEGKLREHSLLKNAINFVEENNYISNNLNLDTNGDGQIDSLTFVISGEDTGWNTIFWPHKWALSTYYDFDLYEFTSDAPTINGVNAYTYTVQLLGDSQDYLYYGINVALLAHEMFHLLSANDLYHYYRYAEIDPVGDWGLMDNEDGPSHMLGYMKYQYGSWMSDAEELIESGQYLLSPLQDGNTNYYKVDMQGSEEYLYLEYRDNKGLYESTLPGTGLLAYRVDFEFAGEGNYEGYYDESGRAVNEVFVFRPGMVDTESPYRFLNNGDYDNDGEIDYAIINQNSVFDEIGYNSLFPIFFNEGEESYIRIYNVSIQDEYLSFEIYIPPYIELNLDSDIGGTIDLNDLILLDDELMKYDVSINNLDPLYHTYYTVDGSEPTTSSTLYTGETISIDATNNIVKTVTYDGIEIIAKQTKEFQFVSSIESEHNPYRNSEETIWYLDFGQATGIEISFGEMSETEPEYDFVTLFIDDSPIVFTGTEMVGELVRYESSFVYISFQSDTYLNEYYGFDAIVSTYELVHLDIIGEETVQHEVNTPYIDSGVEMIGGDHAGYSVETTTVLDETELGIYTIVYDLYNELDILVETVERTIEVVDTTPPEISLFGDERETVELGEDYVQVGGTCTDNYDNGCTVTMQGVVDTSQVGEYTTVYTATDESDNTTTITRTVTVVDTTPPELSLNPMDSTVPINAVLEETGIIISDLSDTTMTIDSDLDLTTAGTYTITYTATDNSGNVSVIERIVHVYEPELEVQFHLEDSLTTIEVGSTYEDTGCSATINGESFTCTVENNEVDTAIAGVYTITYSVDYNGETYTHNRYVFVFDVSDNGEQTLYYRKEEEMGVIL